MSEFQIETLGYMEMKTQRLCRITWRFEQQSMFIKPHGFSFVVPVEIVLANTLHNDILNYILCRSFSSFWGHDLVLILNLWRTHFSVQFCEFCHSIWWCSCLQLRHKHLQATVSGPECIRRVVFHEGRHFPIRLKHVQ